MCKICTDIEQSQKLIEIGIDPSSSDMYYAPSPGFCTDCDDLKVGNYKYDHPRSVPAWSLQKLINMLPDYLATRNKYGTYFNYLDILKNQIAYGKMINTRQSDDLIDCCVDILEWLHDNKEKLEIMYPDEFESWRAENYPDDENDEK